MVWNKDPELVCLEILMKSYIGLIFLGLMIPSIASAIDDDDAMDPKNWKPVKIAGRQKAPEFEDVQEWINSPALTMKELKGKVVVVHFMAFG